MKVKLNNGDWYECFMETLSDSDGNPIVAYAALVFDGHLGHYIHGSIIGLAVAHGMRIGADAPDAVRLARESGAFDSIPGDDDVVSYAIEATDYLNSQIVSDSGIEAGRVYNAHGPYRFDWYEGEFFLANAAWFSVED